MNLLSDWLAKKGIKREEDLSLEEKATFDSYKRLLSGEIVTIPSLKTFCESQLSIVMNACDGKTPLTPIQQAAIHIYTNLIRAIEAPEAEREALERKLEQELHETI